MGKGRYVTFPNTPLQRACGGGNENQPFQRQKSKLRPPQAPASTQSRAEEGSHRINRNRCHREAASGILWRKSPRKWFPPKSVGFPSGVPPARATVPPTTQKQSTWPPPPPPLPTLAVHRHVRGALPPFTSSGITWPRPPPPLSPGVCRVVASRWPPCSHSCSPKSIAHPIASGPTNGTLMAFFVKIFFIYLTESQHK